MTDEASALPRKNLITYGAMRIEVTDPMNVKPVPADCITDLKLVDGMIWLSVGHFAQNGDGDLMAVVNTRLRIPLPMAMDIQNFVKVQLEAAEQAKKAAN
jgi:hypothetical protein